MTATTLETTAAAPRRLRSRRPPGRLTRRQQAALINALFVVAAIVALLFMPEERVLVAPALVLCGIALWFLTTLWAREGAPPVFESGTMWVLATTVYGVIPMIGFAMMGGQWSEYADGRLNWYDFNRSELAHLGWNYVVYTVSFVAVYLAARGRKPLRTVAVNRPSNAAIAAIFIVLLAAEAVTIALRVVYQYDLQAGYAQLEQVAESAKRVPYVFLQFGHIFMSAKLVVQQAILALLLMHWRRWRYRIALFVWLVAAVAGTVLHLGARGPVMLLLLSAGMLYHRLVRPVTFRGFVAAGLILLSAFLTIGIVRTLQSDPGVPTPNILTSTNEFQALFTTAYDIQKRKEMHQLGDVPWQLYVVDLYLLVPSQLLPFEKIDPSQWYLDVLGVPDVGYMFGVMAEAALGFGRSELLVRGALLGLILGLLHRAYMKHVTSFWLTLLYLFISIWTYYTFRATSFWMFYYVVYEFLPVFAFVKLTELLLLKAHRVHRITLISGGTA